MTAKIVRFTVGTMLVMCLAIWGAAVCAAAETVIDNSTTGYNEPRYAESGSNWQTSTNTSLGSIDNNHRWTNAAHSWASWTPDLEAGYYKVYFNRVSHEATNDPAAELAVVHNGKTDTQPIDLRQTKGYVPLGIYDFAGGESPEYVMLKHKTTGKNIRADAVKFVSVPFAPNLTADDITASSVLLSWNGETWASGYKLYRSSSANGPYAEIYSGIAASFTDTGLSPSTVYYYAVSAYDNEAETVKASPVSVVTSPPPAIVRFEIAADTGTAVSVAATVYGNHPEAITGQTIAFVVVRHDGGQPAIVAPSSGVTGTVYSESTDGTFYTTISFVFEKGGGFGDIQYDVSAELNGYTFATTYTDHRVPSAPSELTTARTTTSSIELIWHEAVGAVQYRLYRKDMDDETFSPIGETADTRFVDDGVDPGGRYRYRVAAVNAIGPSESSPETSGIARNSLALLRPVIASQEYVLTPGNQAVDGDPATMWRNVSSDKRRYVELTVDLGGFRPVDTVVLETFRADAMAGFHIAYSNDGVDWQDAYVQPASPTGRIGVRFDPVSGTQVSVSLEVVRFSPVMARFVRFHADKVYPTPTAKPWTGLYSIDVYGDGNAAHPEGVNDPDYEWPLAVDLPNSNFAFQPLQREYDVQVMQDTMLTVTKSTYGQQVWVNGVAADSYPILLSRLAQQDERAEIKIVSADGTRSVTYGLRLYAFRHPSQDPSYELAWHDEFDGASLDESMWDYRTGARSFTNNGGTVGSANRPANATVGDGMLHIALKKETTVLPGGTYDYTSGGIISKLGFGYGYYEARVKQWDRPGFHTSFWSMGTNGIPQVNEVDGFEINSSDPDEVHHNLHQYDHGLLAQYSIASPVTQAVYSPSGYHIYGFERTPTMVRFFVDNKLTFESLYAGPHLPQNVWLTSLAYTYPVDDSLLPGEVSVDYFRYYYKDYGISTPEDAIVVERGGAGYTQTGAWRTVTNAYTHEVAELFAGSGGVNEAASFAGYGFDDNSYKRTSVASRTIGDTIEWTPALPSAGTYEAFVWNPSSYENTAYEARYSVNVSGSVYNRIVDETVAGQRWVSLGQYEFTPGSGDGVKLTVSRSVYTGADAAMFVKVPDAPGQVAAGLKEDGSISVVWTAEEGATAYRVYVSEAENGVYQALQTVEGATEYAYPDGEPGKTYYFRVSSLHDWVESEKSIAASMEYAVSP